MVILRSPVDALRSYIGQWGKNSVLKWMSHILYSAMIVRSGWFLNRHPKQWRSLSLPEWSPYELAYLRAAATADTFPALRGFHASNSLFDSHNYAVALLAPMGCSFLTNQKSHHFATPKGCRSSVISDSTQPFSSLEWIMCTPRPLWYSWVDALFVGYELQKPYPTKCRPQAHQKTRSRQNSRRVDWN